MSSFFSSKWKRHRWIITDKTFFSLLLTGMIIEFSQVGAGFIDGLMISRYLGPDEMAAEGIIHPLFSILGVISGMLAIGMQVRCSRAIGRGNRDEFVRFFSATVYCGTAVSLLTAVLIIVFSKPFAVLLGVSENAANLLEPASKYAMGLGFGVPPLIMTAILASAIQLDSGRKTIQTGALIEAVADVVLDLIAIKIGWGIFGVGLATSVASMMNLLYQCSHFIKKKDRMLHLVKPNIPVIEFIRMLANGNEKAVKRIANIIRPIVLNIIIIGYGGTVAMAALSVRNNFANFAQIFGAGIASAVSLLTGVYFGEVNVEAIDEVTTYAHKMIAAFAGSVCVLLLVFAKPIAGLYVTENDEVRTMVTFAIRMLALQTPLQALIESRIKYLQSVYKRINMNLLILAGHLVFVLLSAFVLGKRFGVYGILACYTVSDALTLLAIFVFYTVKKRGKLPKRDDYLSLSDEFYLKPGDVISLDIRDMYDVVLASEQVMLFCKGHKIDSKIAYFAALSVEELANNIVEYGFVKNRSAHPIIDFRAVITDDRFVIRLSDNCPHYDITELIGKANAKGADKTKNIGIRIVSNVASDIGYMHVFETNKLIITFVCR